MPTTRSTSPGCGFGRSLNEPFTGPKQGESFAADILGALLVQTDSSELEATEPWMPAMSDTVATFYAPGIPAALTHATPDS